MGRTYYLIIILAIVAVVLCISASVILAFAFSKSAQVYYLDDARASATVANEGIDAFIDAANDFLLQSEMPNPGDNLPYKLFGQVNASRGFTIYTNDEISTGELTAARYNDLYSFDGALNVSGGAFPEYGIAEDLLMVSIVREESVYFVAMPAMQIITVLGFDAKSSIIAWNDGRVIYSFENQESNLVTAFGTMISQNLSSEESSAATTSYKSASVDIVFSKSSQYSIKTVYVLGAEFKNSFVSQYVLRYILTALAIILIIVGACLACCRLYITSFNRMYALRSDNVYELKVNQNGKILRANRNFIGSFVADNIFNHTFDFEKSDSSTHFKRFTEGEAIHLKLPNKEGDTRYLTFIQLQRRVNHTLVGADVTETNEKLVSVMNTYMFNPFTNVPNINSLRDDFRNEKKEEISEKIMMFVEVVNLNRYTLMFGERFALSVLKKTSDMLIEKIGGSVYHLNNDIFAIVKKNEDAAKFVSNVDVALSPFSASMQIGEMLVMTDIRFGIVKASNPSDYSYGEYLNMCRVALDNAKRNVRNKHYIFYANSGLNLPTDFSAETVIEQMMQNNEIDVFFQPIYSIKERRIVGFEALSRIVGNRKDEISLTQLIEIIEKNGSMITFGRFVYKKAMLFAKLLQGKPLSVSVNISPIQLMHTGFADEFHNELIKHGIEEQTMNIELTENILIHSVHDVKQKLNILAERGISSRLDDYGTGYSSLAYISTLPFDTVKIDKSLIDSLVGDPKAYTIVENTVNMLRSLGKKIIVEGVETKEQYKILAKLGCDMVQGYLVSPALSVGDALEAIESKREIL